MLALVDRYIFREWLKIFALVLGSMFGLQMIVEVRDSFKDMLGFGAGMESHALLVWQGGALQLEHYYPGHDARSITATHVQQHEISHGDGRAASTKIAFTPAQFRVEIARPQSLTVA